MVTLLKRVNIHKDHIFCILLRLPKWRRYSEKCEAIGHVEWMC